MEKANLDSIEMEQDLSPRASRTSVLFQQLKDSFHRFFTLPYHDDRSTQDSYESTEEQDFTSKSQLTKMVKCKIKEWFKSDPQTKEVEKFLNSEQLKLFKEKYYFPAIGFVTLLITILIVLLVMHNFYMEQSEAELEIVNSTFTQILIMNCVFMGVLLIFPDHSLTVFPIHTGVAIKLSLDYMLSRDEFELNPYMLTVTSYSIMLIILIPINHKMFACIFSSLMAYYYVSARSKYGTLPEELFASVFLSVVYFLISLKTLKKNMLNLYGEILKNRKLVEGMKRVFETFPHGVLIHSDEKNSKSCFTNHEFQEQIQNIRNNLRNLNNIKVRFKHKGEDECRSFSMMLNEYIEAQQQLIKGNEVQQENKVSLKVTSNSVGQLLEQSETQEIEEKYFSIKSLKVDWEGKPSIMHVFIDTTDLHRLEEAQNSIRCQKIMFASTSHEFRTPLNAIINSFNFISNVFEESFELILENKDKIDAMSVTNLKVKKMTLEKFIRMGHNSSVMLLSLVEDILSLSKIEAGTFEVQNEEFLFMDLLNEVNDLFRYQCDQKGLELVLNVDRILELTRIVSDRKRLRQIFLNLISNAFKFTFRGSITIKAEVIYTENGQVIEVRVIDTGIGIKDEVKSKLFTLFSSVSDQGINPNGTGLGLTICQKYLEKLDGDIRAESQYGVGTTIIFQFPYSPVNPKLELEQVDCKSSEIEEGSKCLIDAMPEFACNSNNIF